MNHRAIVAHESARLASHRGYALSELDPRVFAALNPDGHVLGLNGYCMDAPEYLPTGCMTSCCDMPTMQTIERGTTMAQQRAREALAERLIAEILAEEAAS